LLAEWAPHVRAKTASDALAWVVSFTAVYGVLSWLQGALDLRNFH
jgi:hypothetical protein